MNEIEASWFAGLFEGEGTITFPHVSEMSVTIHISMTDEDVIEKCQEITELGTITGPTYRDEIRKPIYRWSLCTASEVESVLVAIRPFMGKRRTARINDALERLSLGDGRVREREHGTTVGYKQHKNRGEEACRPCKDAINAYMRSRRKSYSVSYI